MPVKLCRHSYPSGVAPNYNTEVADDVLKFCEDYGAPLLRCYNVPSACGSSLNCLLTDQPGSSTVQAGRLCSGPQNLFRTSSSLVVDTYYSSAARGCHLVFHYPCFSTPLPDNGDSTAQPGCRCAARPRLDSTGAIAGGNLWRANA